MGRGCRYAGAGGYAGSCAAFALGKAWRFIVLRNDSPGSIAYLCRQQKENKTVQTMQIVKRNKQQEPFAPEKIRSAISRAFGATGSSVRTDELDALERDILTQIGDRQSIGVEEVQDIVETALMAHRHFKVAKAYILYRTKHGEAREEIDKFRRYVKDERVISLLKELREEYPETGYSLSLLGAKFASFYKDEADVLSLLIKAAVELISPEAPKWDYIAGRLLALRMEERLVAEEAKRDIYSFYDKISYLTRAGLYGAYILEHYTREDVDELEKALQPLRNRLFTYSGLHLVEMRYLIRNGEGVVLERPEEMFMGIAMHLAMPEGEKRIEWAKRIYDTLSTLKVTMATPTMSNARKPLDQLSSCFIDVMPDNLIGIYRTINNFAQVSKYGGGMGIYIGKVRAVGSDIRGFKGVAGGVLKWIKLANDTAVAVDQLGVRQGSVALYLDLWHRDMPEFLQIRTNNGDDRMKAHDVFPGICVPDYFWRQLEADPNGVWYMLCPHEVATVKGYCLEDYWGEEWEKRYLDCVADERIPKRSMVLKDMLRLIVKSAVETGTPFIFNRDTVNRMNPNGHCGMIYCSNLCSEIAQNQSEIKLKQITVESEEGETIVVEKTIPGDFVVCNLASLVLGNIDCDNDTELGETINTVVRALDNVIDLNYYPVPYARITNMKMRPIGLGTSGYHHLLAKKGIPWESEEHLRYMDRLFERINYHAVSASMRLAKEKGRYERFEGSDWQTGTYFTKRRYEGSEWDTLAHEVAQNGMRNGYLMAIAPTSSTGIIAGTTAGVDPVMNRFFLEEKKGAIVPRVAPELSDKTFWLYKTAHQIDQNWVVDAASIRSRHIDQAQSVNLYITQQISFSGIRDLYLRAWHGGVKSLYYVRSLSLEVEECETCAS